jgi:hypothetical protein
MHVDGSRARTHHRPKRYRLARLSKWLGNEYFGAQLSVCIPKVTHFTVPLVVA